MRFHREYIGNIVILEPPSNLFGGDETDEIRDEIHAQLAAGRRRFVIDLRRTENMNTPAITMFQRVLADLEDVGAIWAFCNVDRKIEHPLVVLKLVRLFNVCDTRQEALRFLTPEPVEAWNEAREHA